MRLRAWGVLALVAGLFCVGVGRAESVEKMPMPTSYVTDLAGVVDAQSRANIEDICGQLWLKAHAKVLVVTINTLDGDSIEDFTTQLEDKWKVGAKGTDRGLIMLFAVQDHKRRIEVGYGLEGILNDAKVGDIGRSMVPQLREGQYGPAMQMGVQQIADVIAQDAGVTITPPQMEQEAPQRQYVPMRHRTNWVGIVIFVIFLLLAFRGGGRGGGGGGWMWFLLGNMMGGGFGGGRGGGGGDFGGGGGGGGNGGDFGGGFGGGSGGGGASGDW